jgi:hypothetical protein
MKSKVRMGPRELMTRREYKAHLREYRKKEAMKKIAKAEKHAEEIVGLLKDVLARQGFVLDVVRVNLDMAEDVISSLVTPHSTVH